MDRTRWIIFAGVCIVALGALVFFNRQESVDISDVNGKTVITEDSEVGFADNVYGNADSDVVLIEYGDFQCPGCGSIAGSLNKLKEDYKDEMAFVYRHFPLTSIHPNALAAASVAEAAGKQGKFWEMHNILFANQDQWSSVSANERGRVFEDYAMQLHLTLDEYQADVASESISEKINFHRSLGGSMGVDSTPTLFLNGEMLPDSSISDIRDNNAEQLRQRIDEALDK